MVSEGGRMEWVGYARTRAARAIAGGKGVVGSHLLIDRHATFQPYALRMARKQSNRILH
ncbi:MAG: hypothetical protein K2I64_05190 [Muribaculaceae bacterium]|nr:hypothetical protein [Muribaculaceae bacterium]